jgi:hypothetical protein
MTSLSVQPTSAGGKATFNGKASIQDITDPNNVISVGGNSTIQVTMTDNGNPGSSDQIGITVLNNGGGMWFSSNWNGVATTEKTLEAGNLVVRGGAISTGSPRVAAPESVEPTMELAVEASPNPTTGLLKVSVTGAGGQPTVKVRLYNLLQNVAGEWTMPIENGRGENNHRHPERERGYVSALGGRRPQPRGSAGGESQLITNSDRKARSRQFRAFFMDWGRFVPQPRDRSLLHGCPLPERGRVFIPKGLAMLINQQTGERACYHVTLAAGSLSVKN